ncbi:ABC transporter ATP-binding protein [Metallosphaera hakonensis]|nr:ABC transporter ATP-binding protein [Metallosphaera hakonensis]
MALLEVENLSVSYLTDGSYVDAVRDVSFTVEKGDSLAIVGESGSGKTTLAMTLMGLLPVTARVTSGRVTFDGTDLLKLKEEELRRVRWRKMGMVFQASQNALDPVRKVGQQLVELYRYHTKSTKEEARGEVLRALESVNLDRSVANLYPHELSGGMKQRVVIAAAILLDPKLLIADEPTTALDVVTQAEILLLLKRVVRERELTLIFITHDLNLVSVLCKRIMVMYGGTDMEQGTLEDVVASPSHPYTAHLLGTLEGLEEGKLVLGTHREVIKGGCPFYSRCPEAVDYCRVRFPDRREIGPRSVRCLLRGGETRS